MLDQKLELNTGEIEITDFGITRVKNKIKT